MNPGTLFRLRNRDWVLLPSDNADIHLLRPLTGATDDVVAIHKGLSDLIGSAIPQERLQPPTCSGRPRASPCAKEPPRSAPLAAFPSAPASTSSYPPHGPAARPRPPPHRGRCRRRQNHRSPPRRPRALGLRRDQALGEHCFPVRESSDETYRLSRAYQDLFVKTYDFCSEIVQAGQALAERQRKVRYWGALALLRCVMSSPAAAVAALETRHDALAAGEKDEPDFRSFIFESADDRTDDEQPTLPVEAAESTLADPDRRRLRELGRLAKALLGSGDTKLDRCAELVGALLAEGFYPIVWCRYIATADYVSEGLQKALRRTVPDLRVISITGRIGGDERRTRGGGARRPQTARPRGHRLPQRRNQPPGRLQRHLALRPSSGTPTASSSVTAASTATARRSPPSGASATSAPTAPWTASCSMSS